MEKPIVSLVRYEKPFASACRAVELCRGFEDLSTGAKVFIKPNICFWKKNVVFPKWGVITTTRIVEDLVVALKDWGIGDITIGEGMVLFNPRDEDTPADAFERLEYGRLKQRYGVKLVNVHARPFKKIRLDNGADVRFNADFLHSDFLVNVPVLKTHLQTVVSLGIKNLKGLIDIDSRKKCHRNGSATDLNGMIAQFVNIGPPSLTVIDGLFSNEIGPAFEGRVRRSNVLIASRDRLAADMVGAGVLGYAPQKVPHIIKAARLIQRKADPSMLSIRDLAIDAVASFHPHELPYNEEKKQPQAFVDRGICGVAFRKYDLSVCTYCAMLMPALQNILLYAWKGKPWDDVEILMGKSMRPTPGMKKTVLIGQCMCRANKENPDINELIAVKGCPPRANKVVEALQKAGIDVPDHIFNILDQSMVLLAHRYVGNPEFDDSLFRLYH